MAIEIVSYRFKRQYHLHKCPICKRVVRDPNDVCGKISGDHYYPCLSCLQDQRRRFSDDILDAWLEPQEIDRLHHVAPDHVSDDLDARDQERREQQLKEIERHRKENPQAFKPKTQEKRREETHEKMEELKETATILTEEEVVEEMRKIREERKIT